MPFTTKRKAQQMQALVRAHQVKRPRLNEKEAYEKELARAKLRGERVIERAVDAATCTVAHPSAPQSNHVPIAPSSDQDMSPTRGDESLHVGAEHALEATTGLSAQLHSVSPPESVVCKQEPEDCNVKIEPDISLTAPPMINTHTKKVPPSRVDAEEALQKINKLLRPPRMKGHSYKTCKLPWVTRTRYEAMAACLRYFLRQNTSFVAASQQAAIGAGRSIWNARQIRARIRRFIATGDSLDRKHALPSRSLLKSEDVSGEIKLFLQMKGKHFVADDIVKLLNDPELKERLAITKSITVRTAQRWLYDMEYRWRNERPGQYFDGHERGDVVQFRQDIYAPKMKALEPRIMSWDPDTGAEWPPNLGEGQRRIIIWFHDTSTFYAHDRTKLGWHHKDACSGLAKKGQGVSAMVSDWVSGEHGFLKSRDGQTDARKILFAGKNREGYMTNHDICEQFKRAVRLVQQEYPDQDHIFIYDNARIHTKRSVAAPTARGMSKGESSFRLTVVDANGKKVKMCMENPKFPDGSEQQLYLPNGKFKGMVALLRERGYDASGLRAECPGFKCIDPTVSCCCRRMMFNIIDVDSGPKAILQILAEQLGVEVLFLPKFHCELNPIEQCWGYAKWLYRKAPPSSLTVDVEKNMIDALSRVPIKSIRRYVARSRRFVDAYAQGLDGPNAAAIEWARRKHRGHRTTPGHIEV